MKAAVSAVAIGQRLDDDFTTAAWRQAGRHRRKVSIHGSDGSVALAISTQRFA
jgi:hypothetical protein